MEEGLTARNFYETLLTIPNNNFGGKVPGIKKTKDFISSDFRKGQYFISQRNCKRILKRHLEKGKWPLYNGSPFKQLTNYRGQRTLWVYLKNGDRIAGKVYTCCVNSTQSSLISQKV